MGGKKRNRAGYFKVLYKMGSKTWAEPVIKKLKPVIKKLKTGSFDILKKSEIQTHFSIHHRGQARVGSELYDKDMVS